MISTVLIPNIIAMVLLLVLLFSASGVLRQTLLLDTKIFRMMVMCNLFQCVCEIATYAIDGRMLPGFHILNVALNCILFIVNIFFAFLWVIYADYKIYEDSQRVKRRAKKLAIPALVVAVGALVNLFVPVFYTVTEDNLYQRTSLFLLPYIVTYAYLLYGTVFIYRHKNQAKKYVFLPAVLFMLPIIAGSIVQFFFYGVSTTWVGVAISLVAVYVNVQNGLSYTDALSGLYTRIYMYQYLESAMRRKDSKKRIAGIMMDIDNFKNINDEYGHVIGDDAIRSVGKLLHQTLREGCIVARYGGDEFVVLQVIESEEEIEETLKLIEKAEEEFRTSNNKEYELRFSKGISVLDSRNDSIDSFLERMDRAMYKEKNSKSAH